jgi:hypothetical protein
VNLSPIPLPLVDGDTLLIDNSSLEHFTTCPRQAHYSIVRRLKPTGERVPLIFGGIIHKILEARYRACTTLHAQTQEVTNVMLATAQREFDKWTPPEDDFRTFSCAVELIRRYEDAYPFEQFEVVRGLDGSPMIEVPFAIPLGEIAINSDFTYLDLSTNQVITRHVKTIKLVWMGRIDLVYLSENGGGLYVMDHKTTSVMGPSYFSAFTIAHQMYGYAWAVEQLCGKQVSAVVINALGVRKPTRTGNAFEFKREVIPVQRGLLDEWKRDCIYIVADFVEMCRRGYMPKHTAWCVGKFGECPFRKVCTLESTEQREVMLTSGEFVANDWSPLK